MENICIKEEPVEILFETIDLKYEGHIQAMDDGELSDDADPNTKLMKMNVKFESAVLNASNQSTLNSGEDLQLKRKGNSIKEEASVTCPECGKEFRNKSLLKSHLKVHRNRSQLLQKLDKVKNHKKNSTRGRRESTRLSKNKLNDDPDFKIHVKSSKGQNHSGRPKKEKSEKLKCEFCTFTSKNLPKFDSHMLCHLYEEPLSCNFCSYTTVSKTLLGEHMQESHQDSTYYCKYCSFRCDKTSVFKSHMLHIHSIKIHGKTKQFSCNQCNFKTIKLKSFKTHQLNHKEKDEDGSDFEINDSNKSIDSDLFVCSNCNFSYDKDSLLKADSFEATITCPVCDVDRKEISDTVVTTLDDIKYFVCNLCNYVCFTRPGFKTHKLGHKNEKRISSLIKKMNPSKEYTEESQNTDLKPSTSYNMGLNLTVSDDSDDDIILAHFKSKSTGNNQDLQVSENFGENHSNTKNNITSEQSEDSFNKHNGILESNQIIPTEQSDAYQYYTNQTEFTYTNNDHPISENTQIESTIQILPFTNSPHVAIASTLEQNSEIYNTTNKDILPYGSSNSSNESSLAKNFNDDQINPHMSESSLPSNVEYNGDSADSNEDISDDGEKFRRILRKVHTYCEEKENTDHTEGTLTRLSDQTFKLSDSKTNGSNIYEPNVTITVPVVHLPDDQRPSSSLEHNYNSEQTDTTKLSDQVDDYYDDEVFLCSLCSFQSTFKNVFDVHSDWHFATDGQRAVKSEMRFYFSCHQCCYKCNRLSLFKYHLDEHDLVSTEDVSQFTDFLKMKTLETEDNVKHVDGETYYYCKQCKFSSTQMSKLDEHMECHKQIKSYQCKECKYFCYKESVLMQHMKRHYATPLTCEYCGFKCINNSLMKYHMDKHKSVIYYLQK